MTAGLILRRLNAALQPVSAAVRAHGVAVLDDAGPCSAAGWDGRSWAVPGLLQQRIADDATLAAAPLVLTNDPYAGGTTLDQMFLLAPRGAGRVCAALDLAEIGAMRKDVFCRQRETYHEGVRLSLLPIALGGEDWAMLHSLLAANVRQPDALIAGLNAAWAVLSGDGGPVAALAPGPAAAAPPALPLVTGQMSVDRRILHLACAEAVPPCAPSAVVSAALAGVAAAWNWPVWELAVTVETEAGPLRPVPPAAVGDGLALAAACWRAGHEAAGGAGGDARHGLFAPVADWSRP